MHSIVPWFIHELLIGYRLEWHRTVTEGNNISWQELAICCGPALDPNRQQRGAQPSRSMPLGFKQLHPRGMIENSPAFQRRDRRSRPASPAGTAEIETSQPSPKSSPMRISGSTRALACRGRRPRRPLLCTSYTCYWTAEPLPFGERDRPGRRVRRLAERFSGANLSA